MEIVAVSQHMFSLSEIRESPRCRFNHFARKQRTGRSLLRIPATRPHASECENARPDLHKRLKPRELLTHQLFYITENYAGYNTPTTCPMIVTSSALNSSRRFPEAGCGMSTTFPPALIST